MIDTRNPSRGNVSPSRGATHQRRFNKSMDIDLLKLLSRYWLLLAACVAGGWMLAGAYFYITPPTYESSAEIMLLPKDQSLAARGIDGKPDETTLSDEMMATFLDSIAKPRIVKTALDKNQLSELSSLVDKLDEPSDHPALYVIKNLDVSRGGEGQMRDSHIIKVAFRHSNAADAQLVTDAIVKEFTSFVLEEFQDKNLKAAEVIQEAERQQREDLAVTRTRFEQFQKETPILFSPDQSTNIYRRQYEQLQSALTDLRLQKGETQARMNLVEEQLAEINKRAEDENLSQKDVDLERLALIDEKSAGRVSIFLEIFYGDAQTAGFQALQPERFALARTQNDALLQLKSRRTQLLSEFGPSYSEVVALNDQIAEMEKILSEQKDDVEFDTEESLISPEKLVAGYLRLMRNDIAAFESRERQLVEESEVAENNAKDLIQYELQGESLRMAMDRQQAIFDATVDRLRDINMTRDFGGFIINEMNEAKLGEIVWPSLPICLVLGTILGGMFGAGVAGLQELRNRSLRTASDIESVTGLPILSMVPAFENIRSRQINRHIKETGLNVEPAVFTAHSPQSQESEVFRGLRTSLFFRLNSTGSKVVAITSSNSGDGKSTISANLVTSIAQSGKRVLMVEADLRRPSAAKLLGAQEETGLVQILREESQLSDVVQSTDVDNLHVLAAGGPVDNPAELLSSPRMQQFVDDAESQYDVVILDCPPVLAVSDPCIVSSVSDAVLVVVRITPTSRVEVQKTMQMLGDISANVVGVVVNASQLESESGRGKNAYMNSYGYGPRGNTSQRYYIQSAEQSSQRNVKPKSNGSVASGNIRE